MYVIVLKKLTPSNLEEYEQYSVFKKMTNL